MEKEWARGNGSRPVDNRSRKSNPNLEPRRRDQGEFTVAGSYSRGCRVGSQSLNLEPRRKLVVAVGLLLRLDDKSPERTLCENHDFDSSG